MLWIGIFETTLFLTYHFFVQFWPSRLVKATICWPFSFSSLLKSHVLYDSFEGSIIFNVSYKYFIFFWVRNYPVGIPFVLPKLFDARTLFILQNKLDAFEPFQDKIHTFFTGTTNKTHCYSTIKRKKYEKPKAVEVWQI